MMILRIAYNIWDIPDTGGILMIQKSTIFAIIYEK